MAKLRANCQKIFDALADPSVKFVFGRLAAQNHQSGRRVCFIPVGGPIAEAGQPGGKKVAGSAGPIEPGPEASLTQPNVDTRQFECVRRQPRVMVICIAGDKKEEPSAIDEVEELLEAVISATFRMFAHDVVYELERWITQEEERASYGVTGQAVMLTIGFNLPVIYETRKLVRLTGQQETCKLDNTFT